MSEIADPRAEKVEKAKARTAEERREMAACYLRVFSSDDGRRVLADLRGKFGLHRLTFHRKPDGTYDTHAAALLDGERRVMSEIEDALSFAAPNPRITHHV